MALTFAIARRGFKLLVLVALTAALLTARRAEPILDLSTPGAIRNVAFNGTADIFMETIGPIIEGDAKGKGHEKDIEIDSVNVGFSHSAPVGGGGGDPSPPNLSDFALSKRLDAASAKLTEQVLTGDPVEQVYIVFEVPATSTSKPRVILSFELGYVFITSHQMSGSGQISEGLTMTYGEFEMTYHPYKGDGTPLPTITTCWSVAEGLPCAVA